MKIKSVRFDIGEEIFETVVKDGTGMKLEKYVVNKSEFPKVVELLSNKYGFKKRANEKPKDLSWAY